MANDIPLARNVRRLGHLDLRGPGAVGYYMPEPVDGQHAPQSNDVDLNTRGLIYLIDRLGGFDILEYQG